MITRLVVGMICRSLFLCLRSEYSLCTISVVTLNNKSFRTCLNTDKEFLRLVQTYAGAKFCKLQPSLLTSNIKGGQLRTANSRFLTNLSGNHILDITPVDLESMIAEKNIQLFDVREPHELQEVGKIPESVNIPLGSVEAAFKLSPDDFYDLYKVAKPKLDDKDIVFHCRAGVRSLEALNKVRKLGYVKARHLAGGYLAWLHHTQNDASSASDSGESCSDSNSLSTQKESILSFYSKNNDVKSEFKEVCQPAEVTVSLPASSCLTFEQLCDALKSGEIKVFDVREVDEIISTGMMPGAINIPLKTLESSLNLSDDEFFQKFAVKKPQLTDSDIVFHCRSGKRSAKALGLAMCLGYNKARHFPGGWLEWEKRRSECGG